MGGICNMGIYIICAYLVIGLICAINSIRLAESDLEYFGIPWLVIKFAQILAFISFGLLWPYFLWKFEISPYLESKKQYK